MKTLSQRTMRCLSNTGIIDCNDRKLLSDSIKFTKNIYREQKDKIGTQYYRSKLKIFKHTYPGLAGEMFLCEQGEEGDAANDMVFRQTSPAVDNANKLLWHKRMVDLIAVDTNDAIAVKSFHIRNDEQNWLASKRTIESIVRSAPYCNFLITVGYQYASDYKDIKLAKRELVCRALWLIDIKKLAECPYGYFRDCDYSPYSSKEFNVAIAQKRNILIELQDV